MNIETIRTGVVFLTEEQLDSMRKFYTPVFSAKELFQTYVCNPVNWRQTTKITTDAFDEDGPGKIKRVLRCTKLARLYLLVVTDVSDTKILRHEFYHA